jgi:hypothetical protein
MSSRIIVSRDPRNEHRAIGDGNESERSELSAEIHRAAQQFAAYWVLHTKSADMIETPVAIKTVRRKSRKHNGYVEIAWMSHPQMLYPVQNTMYRFGIDAIGRLYDHTYRRTTDFNEEFRIWMPMDDVDASRYSTAVLKQYLLPYLNDMARH